MSPPRRASDGAEDRERIDVQPVADAATGGTHVRIAPKDLACVLVEAELVEVLVRAPLPDDLAVPGTREFGAGFDGHQECVARVDVAAGLATLVAFGGLFIVGYSARPHGHAPIALAASESDAVALRVDLVRPKARPKDRALTLSGTVQGLEETDISPRTNGYVRRWLVDIGDRVEEGQLLAEIDTPELDLEIDEARAALGQSEAAIFQARATRDHSATTAKRYGTLAASGRRSDNPFSSGCRACACS